MATSDSPARSSDTTGGYNCETVAPADKGLECNICYALMREPLIVVCCGEHFCKICIEKIQKAGKPCPLCREESFQTYPQKKVERKILDQQVFCRNKDQGCEWKGELRNLEGHINLTECPKENECGYQKVACSLGCGESHERRLVKQHETESCTKRSSEQKIEVIFKKFNEVEKVVTPLLGRMEQSEETLQQQAQEITAVNQKIKDELLVKMEGLEQKLKEVQQEMMATNQKIKKEYEEKFEKLHNELAAANRKIDEHEKGELEEVKQKTEEIKRKAETLEEENGQLKTALRRVEDDMLDMLMPVPPLDFTVDNFSFLKSQNIEWHSPPFFISREKDKRYKFSLWVQANGTGAAKGKYMSVFVLPLRISDPNKDLKWPIDKIKMKISLLRVSGENDLSREIEIENYKQVTKGSRGTEAQLGAGAGNFIPLSDVKHYMEQDGNEVHIRIELAN